MYGKWLKIKEQYRDGRVAQLGEHLLCKQGVTGSIPVTSTIFSITYSTSGLDGRAL
jgi:hypothetical protein